MIDNFNPYAWIMRLRRRLYREGTLRSVALGIPVISVGNLSAGGTGKTPFTMFLVRMLQSKYGLKCAVVLRGYKRESSGQLIVRDWYGVKANARRTGDEAALYARALENTLVICDASRVSGARMAREMGAEVIVLDDGFQHRRLRRDLDIVLVNALEGIPPVIPFGKGREVPAALDDADLIAVTNFTEADTALLHSLEHDSPGRVMAVTTRITRIRTIGERSADAPTHDLSAKTVLAVSGIGTPEGFESAMHAVAGTIVGLRFPDHADYDEAALQEIEDTAAAEYCDAIVMTTKDEVKIAPLLKGKSVNIPIYVAESTIEIVSGDELLAAELNRIFSVTTA